jgi:hypothetical protein
MKIAVLSESPADDVAIRILVEGLLDSPTEAVPSFPRSRDYGWPAVLRIAKNVVNHVYYRTDADGLVISVDSDDSPVHRESADRKVCDAKCRICQLRSVVANVVQELRAIPGRTMIRTAIGIAVPSLEAWYRCGIDPHVSEATWIHALRDQSFPYDRIRLKLAVYGNDRPSLVLATSRATEIARQLVPRLNELEGLFPNGFGALARDVRGWRSGV